MWRMALMLRLFSAHIFPQNTNFLLSLSSKGSFCKRFSRTFLIFLRPLNFSLLLYHLLWLVQRVGIFFSSPLFTGRLRWVLHIPDSSSRGPSSLCLPQSTWLKKYLYSPLVPSTTASPAARCHEGRDFSPFFGHSLYHCRYTGHSISAQHTGGTGCVCVSQAACPQHLYLCKEILQSG